MNSAFVDDLSIDRAGFSGRVGRGLRIDPKAVDANITILSLHGASSPIVAIGIRSNSRIDDSTGIKFGITICLQNNIFLRQFDILAVGQRDIEIVEATAIQDKNTVALLTQGSLDKLADEHGPLDTTFLPLSCGRAEDVDDGVGS